MLGGAAVQVLGTGLTVAKPIVLNGTGISSSNGAALENLIGGSNTWSGPITLQSEASGIDAWTTLTVTGAIGGAANFTKVGVGTAVLNDNSTFTGNATIANGIVNVQNSNGLVLPPVPSRSIAALTPCRSR